MAESDPIYLNFKEEKQDKMFLKKRGDRSAKPTETAKFDCDVKKQLQSNIVLP